MYKYSVEFILTEKRFEFEIRSHKEEYIERFCDDLFQLFSTYNKETNIHTINGIAKNTKKFQKDFSVFFNAYKSEFPELKGVYSQLKNLSQDEIFIFVPANKHGFKDKTIMGLYVKSQNKGEDFQKLKDDFENKFSNIIENYEVSTLGEYRRTIGNKNKLQRICRFCKQKAPIVTFKTKAHAISEALGNKTLILFDECDSCNNKFSRSIEGDIINYLSIYRTFFSIRGKDGLKKFKGKNFTLSNEDGLKLVFDSLDDRPQNPEEKYEVKLKTSNPINQQNIYKILSKYFLSVIEEKELQNFEETINWINGNLKVLKLPKIIEIITYSHFSIQPTLIIYMRKNDNRDIPFAVCEFQLACVKEIFIIPFSNQDEKDFTNEKDYEIFLNVFDHYSNQYKYSLTDFSNNDARNIDMVLSFKTEDK